MRPDYPASLAPALIALIFAGYSETDRRSAQQ
jgi:hypothetical protein